MDQQLAGKKRKAEEQAEHKDAKKVKAAEQTPTKKGQQAQKEVTTPGSEKKGQTQAAPKSPATPSGVQEFEKQLKDVLKKDGKQPLSSLGSKVKRPPSVPKLGQFIKERPHLFKVNNDEVELKA